MVLSMNKSSTEQLNESFMEISLCKEAQLLVQDEQVVAKLAEEENKVSFIIENKCTSLLKLDTILKETLDDIHLNKNENHDTKIHDEELILKISNDIQNIFDNCVTPGKIPKLQKKIILENNSFVTPNKKVVESNEMDFSLNENDSLILNEIKIEINPLDCLDESPYLKTIVPQRTNISVTRKRLSCETESPNRKIPLANNLFHNQTSYLSSTPFNNSKKWKSSSCNFMNNNSEATELVSPLKKIDNNLINCNISNKIDNLLISNFNVLKTSSDMCVDLIGDFSKTFALPLISGRHKDLKTISPDALASLLRGEYGKIIDYFTIVDARYPYEYEGGHIDGAKNIFRKEDINNYFFDKKNFSSKISLNSNKIVMEKIYLNSSSNLIKFKNSTFLNNCKKIKKLDVIKEGSLTKNETEGNSLENSLEDDENSLSNTLSNAKRHVIIFHCEFSSERGPSMYRHLRNKDREINEISYPKLYHPELYLLDGGYKLFFEKYKEFCCPQGYLPMHSTNHKNDLVKFKKKSKSWNCERKWSSLFKTK